jgi:hypothetical protein
LNWLLHLYDCVLNVMMNGSDDLLLNGVISFPHTLRKDFRHAIRALNIDGHSLEFNAEWTELRLDVFLAEREFRNVPI